MIEKRYNTYQKWFLLKQNYFELKPYKEIIVNGASLRVKSSFNIYRE